MAIWRPNASNTMLSMSLDTPVILHIVYFTMFVSRFPSWSADFFHLWTYGPAGFQWDPDPTKMTRLRWKTSKELLQNDIAEQLKKKSAAMCCRPQRCVDFKTHGVQSCYCSERSQQLGAPEVLGAIFFWRRELSRWFFSRFFVGIDMIIATHPTKREL